MSFSLSPRKVRPHEYKGSLTARKEFPSPRTSPRLSPRLQLQKDSGRVEWARSHTLLKSKQRYGGSSKVLAREEQYQSHEFSFDAVFRNPDTKQLFHSFLVYSQNEDPFIFYDQVSLFKATGSAKIATTIITNFIQERAHHEVNLGQQLRLTIMARYEECQRQKLVFPIDLFDSAQKTVYLELKHDPFHRFISSTMFAQFANAKDEEFLSSLRIPDELPSATNLMVKEMSPRARKMSLTGSPRRMSLTSQGNSPRTSPRAPVSYGSEEVIITDPDIFFQNLYLSRDSGHFTRADVMFWLTYLADSEHWAPVGVEQKLKLQCFYRNPPDKNYKVMKSSFYMPYPIKTVLRALTADRRHTFPTVQSETSSSVTATEVIKLPFPYQDREFVTCNSVFFLETSPQRYILLKKSLGQGVYQDEIRAAKNSVRGHLLLGGWIIERGVNDISTRVIMCKVVNMGGFVKGDSTWKKVIMHICKNEVLVVLKDLSVYRDEEQVPKLLNTLKVLNH